jgi:hypothetical protein
MFTLAQVKIPEEFFTKESVFTFTGITGATLVIANGLQRAFNFNPKWLALIVAEILCITGTYLRPDETASDFFLAVLNGFLVFCTVTGGNETVAARKKLKVETRQGNARGFFESYLV